MRLSNVNSVKVISVVLVNSIVGEGTLESPIKAIREIFTLEGELIARVDADTAYELWEDPEPVNIRTSH